MSYVSKKCDILIILIKIKILSDFDLSIYIYLYYIFYDKIIFFSTFFTYFLIIIFGISIKN